MCSAESLAWAAGLFEGEGTITNHRSRARLGLKMIDEDVVRRFAATVGAGRVYGPYQYEQRDGSARRPFFYWYVEGDQCRVVAGKLQKHLGERRRKRLLEVFEEGAVPSRPPAPA